ncbi:MAG TPA: hypothetical protein PKC21_06830 [Oligoflexia bacterium]|nr:hypothetical protein [Oligoflexia bacterium]HMR25051.1 hypothetical protein [Oligoflexia bacterium]
MLWQMIFAGDYIILDQCLNEATTMDMFRNAASSQEKLNFLRKDYSGGRLYSYTALRQNLTNNLNEIQVELNNNQSLINKHLRMCMVNERYCHIYFNPQNEIHQRWFCATHIYRNVLTDQYTQFNTLVERCGESSVMFHSSYFPASDHPAYQRDCYDRNGNSKLEYYKGQRNVVETEMHRYYQQIENRIHQSSKPEAMAYIIRKLDETLGEIEYGDVRVTHQQYQIMRFANSLAQCTIGDNSSYNRRTLAATSDYAVFGQNILSMYEGVPDSMVYNPQQTYERSQMVDGFTPIERFDPEVALFLNKEQYRINTAACDELPEEEKINCILQSYSQLPWLDRSETEQEVERRWQQLYEKNARAEQNRRVENLSEAAYPKIFRGFLPYQFYRTTNAKILMELQKMSVNQGRQFLATEQSFIDYAEQLVCGKSAFHFCQEQYQAKRIESRKKLYQNIKSGAYSITFHPTPQQTALRPSMVDLLNAKITDINDYCYNTAAQLKRRFDNETYNESYPLNAIGENERYELMGALEEKLQNLYTTPSFGSYFAHSSMIALLKFDAQARYKTCFNQGYIFGGPLKTTESYRRMMEDASHGVISPAMRHMHFKQRKLAPDFQVSMANLQAVEQALQQDIMTELNILEQKRNLDTPEGQLNFLKESIRSRVFALLDFALDNPSEGLGDAYCKLLDEANCDEVMKENMIKMAMIVPHVMALFLLPGAGNIIIELAIIGTAVSISGVATYHMIVMRKNQQSQVDRSLASTNISPQNAAYLQSYFREDIKNLNLILALELAIFVATDYVLLREGVKTINYIKKTGAFQKYFSRQMLIDHAIRIAPKGSVDFLNQYRYSRELFARSDQVSDQVFDDFIRALKEGDGLNFARNNFPIHFPEINPSLTSQLFSAVGDGLNYIWKRIWDMPLLRQVSINYYKLMYQYTNKWWVTTKRMIEILNEALQRGRINQQQFEELINGMPEVIIVNGKAVLKINSEIKALAGRFLDEYVMDTNGMRSFLEPFVYSDILSPQQWQRAIANFERTGRKILTKEDAKMFISVIKFSRREINSIADELRRSGQFVAGYYQKRTNFILDHIDEFLDVAHLERLKQRQRFIQYLKQMGRTSEDEIDELHRFINQIDDYDLHYAWNHQSEIAQKIDDITETLRAKPGSFLNDEHVQYYIREQQQYVDYFFKSLDQALGIGNAPVIRRIRTKRYGSPEHRNFTDAYAEARHKTRMRKTIHGECSLPNSPVKKIANKVMANQAKQISLVSNMWGYVSVKYDDYDVHQGLDLEWITRLAYDLAVPQLGTHLSMKALTSGEKRALSKMGLEWLGGIPVSAVEFGGYWFFSEYLWNSSNQAEALFAKEVRQSENLPKDFAELFKDYPEIYQGVMQRLEKVENFLIHEHPPVVMNDEFLYDLAVKEGLIEEVLESDADFEKELLDALSDFMYDEAYDNRPQSNFPILGNKVRLFGDGFKSREWLLENQDIPASVHESVDRIMFYRLFDLFPNSQIKYIRSQLVYSMLCKYRYSQRVTVPAAIAVFAIIKGATDPIKYHLREQNTGH